MIMKRSMIAAALILKATASFAQISDDAVRIGVLNDRSGPYADFAGEGSVVAARLAVEDFGGTVAGKPIEILYADHQNKADVGAAIAKRWFDVDGVDLVIDMPNSAVALAVQNQAREMGRVTVAVSAINMDIHGPACTPTSLHWGLDTYSLAAGPVKALIDRGEDRWFFLTVDYSGGHSLEKEGGGAVLRNGGTIAGNVRHPLNVTDMSSFLLQAQSSKAKVIALASAGHDTVNAIKGASEFGLADGGQKLVALFFSDTEVRGLGLPVAQNMMMAASFYWDRDEQSRAFSRRFFERRKAMPTQFQAGVYTAIAHYLKAITRAGTDDGKTVVAAMKDMPVDLFGHPGKVRADGRMVFDSLLMQVKTPAESKDGWDLLKLVATVPAEAGFRPIDQGGCPLVAAAKAR